MGPGKKRLFIFENVFKLKKLKIRKSCEKSRIDFFSVFSRNLDNNII